MGANAVVVQRDSGNTLGRNVGAHGVHRIGGTRLHFGSDGGSGPHQGIDALDRLINIGPWRRRRKRPASGWSLKNLTREVFVTYSNLRICKNANQILANFLRRVTGQNPAVDIGFRDLRGCVVRVAGRKAGWNARGSQKDDGIISAAKRDTQGKLRLPIGLAWKVGRQA